MHYIRLFGIIKHISEDYKTPLVVRKIWYTFLCKPFGFGLESQFENPCTMANYVLLISVHAYIIWAHEQLNIA